MAMEILGGFVHGLDAKRNPNKPSTGFSLGIGINDLRLNNNKHLELDYVYSVVYGDMGTLNIRGTLLIKDDDAETKKVKDEWDKTKKLPNAYQEAMANIIPNIGMANGIMIARVMDFPPPIPPFKIEKAEKKK